MANQHPTSVGSDGEPFFPLEIEPVAPQGSVRHMRSKQTDPIVSHLPDVNGADEYPFRFDIPPEQFDQLPGTHPVEVTIKMNMQISRAMTAYDSKSRLQSYSPLLSDLGDSNSGLHENWQA